MRLIEKTTVTPNIIPSGLAPTLIAALIAGDSAPLNATLSAATTAAENYRKTTAVIAVAARERFNDALKDARNALRKFRELGVSPLSASQGQAVVEALKLGNAMLNPAEGASGFLPLQLLEILVDTDGFSTVAENVAAALAGDAPPVAPAWSNGFAEISGNSPQASLASELRTVQQRLTETIGAASAALVDEQDAAALLLALTTIPGKPAP